MVEHNQKEKLCKKKDKAKCNFKIFLVLILCDTYPPAYNYLMFVR